MNSGRNGATVSECAFFCQRKSKRKTFLTKLKFDSYKYARVIQLAFGFALKGTKVNSKKTCYLALFGNF